MGATTHAQHSGSSDGVGRPPALMGQSEAGGRIALVAARGSAAAFARGASLQTDRRHHSHGAAMTLATGRHSLIPPASLIGAPAWAADNNALLDRAAQTRVRATARTA